MSTSSTTKAVGPKKLVRRLDWGQRMTDFIVESRKEGLKCDWENNHCAGWVADLVELMTGKDFMVGFEDTSSPQNAHKSIKLAGYQSLEDVIRANFPEKPVVLAKRGDIVLVPPVGEEFQGLGMSNAVAIADPPYYWALGTEGVGKGLVLDAIAAFGVGEE